MAEPSTEIVKIRDITVILEKDALNQVISEHIVPIRFTLARAMALLQYRPKLTLRQWCDIFTSWTKPGRRAAKQQIRQSRRQASDQGDLLLPLRDTPSVMTTVVKDGKAVREKRKLSPTDKDGNLRFNAPIDGVYLIKGGMSLSSDQAEALYLEIARLEAQEGRMATEAERARLFQTALEDSKEE